MPCFGRSIHPTNSGRFPNASCRIRVRRISSANAGLNVQPGRLKSRSELLQLLLHLPVLRAAESPRAHNLADIMVGLMSPAEVLARYIRIGRRHRVHVPASRRQFRQDVFEAVLDGSQLILLRHSCLWRRRFRAARGR
jgi:hypothetical protein